MSIIASHVIEPTEDPVSDELIATCVVRNEALHIRSFIEHHRSLQPSPEPALWTDSEKHFTSVEDLVREGLLVVTPRYAAWATPGEYAVGGRLQ